MSDAAAPTQAPAKFKFPRRPRPRDTRLTGPRNLVILGTALTAYVGISWLSLQGVDLSTLRFEFDPSALITGTLALQIHVTSAVATFAIGLFLLSGLPKGTRVHKRLGWSWVVFMALTAISSFFLVGLNGNHMSWIHGLSAWTVIILPFAVAAARRHDVKAHAKHMRGMFLGGMLIAGLFSFLPGRIMWSMFFTI